VPLAVTATGQWFHNALAQALRGNVRISDPLYMALLSATPDLDSAVHWADVVADDISPTPGGNLLSSVGAAATAANAWGVIWAASTTYPVGSVIRSVPPNGNLYRAVVGGVSGSSEPPWPTVFGEDVADGTVQWVNCGTSITVLTASSESYTVGTGALSPTCAVIYDAASGNAATMPLVTLSTFTTPPVASAITVIPDPNLGYAAQTLP
jgi:hypothetical protein